MDFRIDEQAVVSAVAITVSDLDRALAFYTRNAGLHLFQREPDSARLGAPDGPPFLFLHEHRNARHPRGTSGLYHFAILLPSRTELARALTAMLERGTRFTGFADHLVSEALYLSDPDGNGIELYRDRPRQEWTREGGFVRMTVDPLDLDGLAAEAAASVEPWSGLPAGTRLGHIHLHVSSIEASERFYSAVFGFDLTARLGRQASFFSAGGYHHHIGVNTWAGEGAPPPPPDAVGLREFHIELPSEAGVRALRDRVTGAGMPVIDTDSGLVVRDPSGNTLRVVSV